MYSPLWAFFVLVVSVIASAQAQEHSRTFGTFRANLAVLDNARDHSLARSGFQLAASVGRPLAPDLAGIVEVAVTTVRHHAEYYPCVLLPGCGISSGVQPGETGLSLAPGLQWSTSGGARKAAVTLTPGVLWFVSHPAGTRALVPKVGARFDLGWLLPAGPRVGLGLGIDWWGSDGTMPAWAVPIGLTVGIH
jgi:hypothetical protein